MGEPATTRSVGADGSTESNHRGAEPAIEQEVEKSPAAQRLMTHPGVGALTALAFVLILGEANRFHCGKQVASYLGWYRWKTPAAIGDGSGHIPSRGVRSCAFCWWKRRRSQCAACRNGAVSTFHLTLRRGRKIAKVRDGAETRRLPVLDVAQGMELRTS